MTSDGRHKPSVLMVSYQYAPAADGGVVTARFPGSAKVEHLGGVDVHRVWAIPRPGRFTATFIASLPRFLLTEGRRYDIWHAHQAYYNAGVASCMARLLGKRSIVKDAASGPYGDVARLRNSRFGDWVRRELTRADAVISLNAEMTDELLAAGVASSRIRLIPNGVDCTRFSPPSSSARTEARANLGLPPDRLLAVFAGRLAADKGTRYLIEAWRIVEQRAPRAPWSLVIAGDEVRPGEFRAWGERTLKKATFIGKIPDVRRVLHAADVLVHPSLSEGLSNIVLEAMSVGLPVVVTRTGELRKQIEDGVTGVLVPPRHAGYLAEGIISLFENGRLRATMGEAGRRKVRATNDFNAVLDAYEELYDELT